MNYERRTARPARLASLDRPTTPARGFELDMLLAAADPSYIATWLTRSQVRTTSTDDMPFPSTDRRSREMLKQRADLFIDSYWSLVDGV